MKFARHFKSAVARLTAIAMAVTMLPAAGLGSVQAAATDSNMVMHWDMTTNEDGTVKDLTNNNHNGTIVDAVESTKVEGVDVLNLNGGYVKIPDGTIRTDMDEVTVNMLVKVTQNVKSSWMWALGTSNKRYMYITGCSNQDSKLRGGVGFVPDSGGNGWNYESVIGGDKALDEGVWQNITATYSDATKDFTFYLNGQKQNSINMNDGNAKETTLQGLMTAGDGLDGYMGWSLYPEDPKFKGSVADFRIYDKALSDAEVTALQADIEEMLDSLSVNDFTATDIHLAETDCLGANASKDEIKADLALPSKTTIGEKNLEGNITKWVSSDPFVISAEGKVTIPLLDTTVTMTATVERNGVSADKALTFTVIGNPTDENLVLLDSIRLTVPNADNIRGNVSLPKTGANGSAITWTSSNESVIKTTASGSILPGIVTRQSQDTKVTLTAKLSKNNVTMEKKFECIVKKAIKTPETTDYIFAYFPYTSHKDERIYFGVSEDGLNFKALNNGQFVLESRLGTHGLRDPFIIRSPEGDRFYLIATDLTVAGLEQDGVHYPGQNWDQNQRNGSQKIMVWESTDLVNWSDQRECKVARDNAGCTWAPEAYWDDETGQYVVFWASKTGDDGYGKQRVYYATTRDFYNFSEAQVWIEQSGSVIDTTVIKVGDYYYRYTKNEDGGTVNGTPSKRIFCERSKSLTSKEWDLVHPNSLDISGGQIEGGCIFKINNDDVANAKEVASLKGFTLDGNDVYCLVADRTGATIFPGLSSNIEEGNFHVIGTGKNETVNGKTLYSMPEPDASHGTIMPITSEEYNNLKLKWDASYQAAAKAFVDKADAAEAELALSATEVASDITLPAQTSNGAAVAWESSNEAVLTSAGKVTRPSYAAGDASVELTATITVAGNDTVRNQVRRKSFRITVAAKDPVYFTVKFDSNGGSEISNGTVIEGQKASKPKDPTRKGYTFDGWYLGNAKYDFNTPVNDNITLTARWKAVPSTYTVKFDSNGGSKVSSKKVQSGKTVASPKTTRAKYTFVGWYKGSKKYNFNAKVTSNLTLKAKWKKVTVSTTAIKSAKNNKSKKCDVTVKKISGAKGYRVTYATDKKFKKNKKTVMVKSSGKVTLTKLKKGKKYYIKAQAYKVDSKGSKVYGKDSKVKSVTIRK